MYTPLQNEQELLSLVAAGDEAAFTQVFNAHKNKIFTVAYKLTESPVYAEEILQDVFLKVWLKRETLTAILDFSSWLFIITRNQTFSYLKQIARAERLKDIPPENLSGGFLSTDSLLLDKDYQAILQEAIERLTPQQKQVYHLNKIAGMKREAIAQKMGISPETVKVHLGQAMKNIRAFCMSRLVILLLPALF